MVSVPDTVAGLPQTNDGFAARGTRILPLSGKSDASLRNLAKRYLAWLDERESALASEGAASDPALSDMAWTAGVGRSHFDHRSAVVFRDLESLREGLLALVETSGISEPRMSAKAAFVYTGTGNEWAGIVETLYASEPVVRAVLDRCEAVLGEERDASLLNTMLGRPGSAGNLNDPQWQRPAIYALECALTALWSSVGVRPGVVLGHGPGALAAAQAAGVLRLEDGLRLATALDDPGAVLEDVAMGSPSVTIVDRVSGRIVGPDEVQDWQYWGRQVASEPETFASCVGTLAAAGVDTIVEVVPVAALGTMLTEAWSDAASNAAAPSVLSSLGRPPDREAKPTYRQSGSYIDAVAGAYEAGFAVSFAGMFAGETRRRISLPDYPFDRRRHWIMSRERQVRTPA